MITWPSASPAMAGRGLMDSVALTSTTSAANVITRNQRSHSLTVARAPSRRSVVSQEPLLARLRAIRDAFEPAHHCMQHHEDAEQCRHRHQELGGSGPIVGLAGNSNMRREPCREPRPELGDLANEPAAQDAEEPARDLAGI